MELKVIRKKLEEVAHMSQELKNTYYRLDENEKREFNIGYPLDVEVDELVKYLHEWSEIQLERNK